MNYFTLASLTLLATSASAKSNEAVAPAKNEDNIFTPVVNYIKHAANDVSELFYPSVDLIEARLVKPKPLSADKFVTIDPTDNCCVAVTKSQFYKALYAETDPKMIKKMIFCPNATAFLKDLDSAKLASNASGPKLQYILTALMLRRGTLIDKYSEAFVDTKFMNCYNALWNKVQGSDPAQQEYWPCDDKSCSGVLIKTNFDKFINTNEDCKVVLKDQLEAYTEKVIEAANKHQLLVGPAVRNAIKVNLNGTPHLGLPFSTLYDSVSETNNQAAASKIQESLADIKMILDQQTAGTSTVYADAEKCFNVNYKSLLDPTKASTPASADNASKTKTPAADTASKTETPAADTASKIETSNLPDTPETPTKTDKTPTQTTL